MKRVSIKRDIYLYLFGLVISLTAIYGLMISQSYQIGLNESAKYGFLYELKLAETEFLATGKIPQSQSSTLQVYSDFNQIPAKFLQQFDWETFENDVIYEDYIANASASGGYGEYLYAALHYVEAKNSYLYVVSQYDEAVYTELLSQSPPESVSKFNSAFLIVGALLLFVFLLIRLLIHRLTKPIITLSQWSLTLNLQETNKLEKFRYTEVDLLAKQLIESVKQQREAIEREEFFLRAASHELRTPVSIISASGEMLTRLSDSMTKGGQRAVARINRSVVTMQNLITTLLWMSRNQLDDLEIKEVDLEQLVQTILANHQYLQDGKQVAIKVNASPQNSPVKLPSILVEIVLTNLIRNALQHTKQGAISIELSGSDVQVTNSLEDSESSSSEVSFGIGLILIERLCRHQEWKFEYHQDTEFIASVSFQSHRTQSE
ncbi:HAMP domain-containing histidine kinase [Vibrio tubiashii]|uniref:sensor histidine kinase n=1 Tax=Vibrio tubiashii TaxID=29498 RepID=UPI001EFC7AB6|nr:HAMP domain-containing histidine kinase [Vibrio tubiashii]MCG9614935.1 HAMP domain-containing histidine kinase [Vibrio tubiashii]MCG9686629.1 HAMP domain-containing histidine kinase [Vibrio tubiashii]